MMVRLKDAQFSDSSNTLEIRKAPVQISGSHVAFVKFGESTAPGEVKAFPYLNGGFSTTPMTFSFPLPLSHTSAPKIAQKFRIFGQPIANANIENTKNARPQSTLENIDKSPMNNDGWYVYGFPTPKGEFLIQAVLPRKAVAFEPQAPSSSEAVRGETPNAMAKDWLERHLWDTKRLEANQGKITQTMLPHAAGGHSASWKMGDKFVVLNLFSWFAVNGEAERKSPLRSGHFAMGSENLLKIPSSKELPAFKLNTSRFTALTASKLLRAPWTGRITSETFTGDGLTCAPSPISSLSSLLLRTPMRMVNSRLPGTFLTPISNA
jgi:predicted Abi (CAAX) family protease